eukprot:TRINITY_DN1051_c0_g3_i1.p1 TRINITY_DN1051_c0_g3~~TRINITY_DN1051_c0_g3_i1.p1  ORF type:complete len:2258 (+),score=709.38 TRINITY_DN1051_c0_g3_i1:430-6774(+)
MLPKALQHRALCCIPGDSPLRVFLYRMTHTSMFESVIMFLILANCVFLALHDPTVDKQEEYLDIVEWIFISCFTLELCMKVIAHGFVLHPHSYLRSGWNRLDCIIILTAFLASLPTASNYSAMRALRALRPLRSINSIPGLKVIVYSLFASVRGLMHVLSLVVFFFLVFGILGVQLFMGRFRMRCVDPLTGRPPPEDGEGQWCKNGTTASGFLGRSCPSGPPHLVCREWRNPNDGYVHFDHIGTAWLVVFQCITMEGWVDQMYRVQDSWGQLSPLYFIPLVILGSFFLLNLALAVIFEKFSSAKEKNIEQRLLEHLLREEELAEEEELLRSGQDGTNPAALPAAVNPLVLRVGSVDYARTDGTDADFGDRAPTGPSIVSAHACSTAPMRTPAAGGSQVGDYLSDPPAEELPAEDLPRPRRSPDSPAGVTEPFLKEAEAGAAAEAAQEAAAAEAPPPPAGHAIPRERHVTLTEDDLARRPDGGPSQGRGHSPTAGSSEEHRRISFADTPDFMRRGSSQSADAWARRVSGPTAGRRRTLASAADAAGFGPRHAVAGEERRSSLTAASRNDSTLSKVASLLQVVANADAVVSGTQREGATRAGRRSTLHKEALLRELDKDATDSTPQLSPQLRRHSNPAGVFPTVTELHHSAAPRRNPVQVAVQQLTESMSFQWSVLGCIIVNTVLLSIEHHGQPGTLTDVLNIANYVFIGIFAAEMVLKLTAMGPLTYVRDSFNILDGTVVVISLVELSLSGGSFVSVFRALRLLRVFKLMKNFPSLRNLVRVILKAVAETGYLTIVILLYLVIAALVGMRLFGGKFTARPGEEKPRATFDAFGWSMLTVFQILTRDDWVEPMWDAMRTTTPLSCLYFVSLVILGDFLFLNLFLAILINAFDRYMNGPADDGIAVDSSDDEELFAEPHAWRHKRPSTAVLQDLIARHSSTFSHWLEDAATSATAEAVLALTPPQLAFEPAPAVLSPQQCNRAALRAVSAAGRPDCQGIHACIASVAPPPPDPAPQPAPGLSPGLQHCAPPSSGLSAPPPPLSRQGSRSASDRPFATAVRALRRQSLGGASTAAAEKGIQHAIVLPETNGSRSLGILGPHNMFRRWITFAVTHRHFENMILFLILVSSVLLAVEDPRADSNEVLDVLNVLFSAMFLAEMVLKVLAWGFIAHPGAYLRDGWNVLDAVVVCISVFSLAFSGFEIVKIFRALRALRPLRVVNRNIGLKLVVRTLLKSLPAVANVAIIALLIYLIFGILGVQLFAGKMYRCWDPDDPPSRYEVRTQAECENPLLKGNSSRRWVNNDQNFDHIGVSVLTLFEVSTLELWSKIMYATIDHDAVGRGPLRNNSPWIVGPYYCAFVVIASFFIMNLFVGVIIWSYTVEKAALDSEGHPGEGCISEAQEEWRKMQRFILTFHPKVRMLTGKESYRKKGNTLDVERLGRRRRAACLLASSPHLEVMVMATILLNVVVMSMEYYGMDDTFDFTLQMVNHVCSGIFIVEASIKIYAWHLEYFLDTWNRFDFFLVVLSFFGIFILVINAESPVDPTVLRIFRIFRMARMVRLVRSSRGTRVLLETLWYSLPFLSNIGLFLALLFFIYATLGLFLFYDVERGEYLDYHANFDSWPRALLVLFRVCTGENWNGLMHDLMINKPDCETPPDATGRCPTHWSISPLYFVSFIIMASQVLLNLFVAIILDNFATTILFERSLVTIADVNNFQQCWSFFDPDADLLIPTYSFIGLMHMLGPPLGLPPGTGRLAMLRRAKELQIVEHGGTVHFVEVMIPLCRHALGIPMSDRHGQQQEWDWFLSFPDLYTLPTIRYRLRQVTVDQYFASTYIAAAFRRERAREHVAELRRRRAERRALWLETLATWGEDSSVWMPPRQISATVPAAAPTRPKRPPRQGRKRAAAAPPAAAARPSSAQDAWSLPPEGPPDGQPERPSGAAPGPGHPAGAEDPVVPFSETPESEGQARLSPASAASAECGPSRAEADAAPQLGGAGPAAGAASSPPLGPQPPPGAADAEGGDAAQGPAPPGAGACGAPGEGCERVSMQVVHTHQYTTTIINNNYFILGGGGTSPASAAAVPPKPPPPPQQQSSAAAAPDGPPASPAAAAEDPPPQQRAS